MCLPVGACVRRPNLTTFDGTLQLFLTLDLPSDVPRATRGAVRQELVDTIRTQVTQLMASPNDRPYPQPISATQVRWIARRPTTWLSPGVLPKDPDVSMVSSVLRTSLRTLVTGRLLISNEVSQWFRREVPRSGDDIVESRQRAMAQLTPVRRVPTTLAPPAASSQAQHATDGASSSTSAVQQASLTAGDHTEDTEPLRATRITVRTAWEPRHLWLRVAGVHGRPQEPW